MEQLAPEQSRELVTAAARKAGVRVIFQTRCGSEQEGRDGDLYLLRFAPHSQLLPLCRAMVLHGGAGTTHAALRGGTPAVVVPFIIEQRLWGDLLHRAGSATKPLKFWKATAETLADRIREAIDSEKMQQRAADLARAVAREDGAGTAAGLVQQLDTETGSQ
jgi:sterol 3beta-glucosyltransferase